MTLQVEIELRRIRDFLVDYGSGGAISGFILAACRCGEKPYVVSFTNNYYCYLGHWIKFHIYTGLCDVY